jgi:hypothetical protein
MSQTLSKPIFRLCEVVADIAYIAGHRHYHSGDSREDVQNFILWAQEFEEANERTEWGTAGHDYMTAIELFTDSKLNG